MDPPMICSLSDAELRERRTTILESIRSQTVQIASLPNGYSYTFRGKSEVFLRLAHLIAVERQCCRFLTFTIVAAAGIDDVVLEITGPAAAKSIIADFFGGA